MSRHIFQLISLHSGSPQKTECGRSCIVRHGQVSTLSCLPRPQIRRPKAAGQIEAAHRRYPAAERTHRVALEHRSHVVRAAGVGGQGDAVFE